jgi:hypothetical protein
MNPPPCEAGVRPVAMTVQLGQQRLETQPQR